MSEELRLIEFVPPAVEAIAAELGYIDETGLALTIMRTRSALEQRERVMSGDCDVALTAIDNLIAWNAGGDDLRLLAQVERTTVLDLIAQPDVGSVMDLAGRALAVDSVDSGFSIVLRKLLADNGLGEHDYRLLGAGGIQQRFEAIHDGRAAAGLLGPPWSYDALEAGLTRLMTAHHALPSLPGIGLAVRASRLDELRRPIDAYLTALRRAIRWIGESDREQVLAVLIGAGFDSRGAADLLAVCPADLVPSREGVALLFRMRRELGLLPDKAPKLEDVFAPDALSTADLASGDRGSRA